jgi:hypothetical protein
MSAMQQLLDIMARLRDPQSGCPWDLEQDFSTIAPYTLEEAHEVADAIARGDMEQSLRRVGRPAVAGGVPCPDGQQKKTCSISSRWLPASSTR